MARSLPPNLVSLFTQALKSYQLPNATFRVLCSLTPSSLSTPTESLILQPPQTPPKALLVLDSSFNPPTLAHQGMALSALSECREPGEDSTPRSRVLLLLAVNNADKAPKPAAFPQRLAMMYIFAQDLLSTTSTLHEPQNTCEAVDIAVTTEPYFHAKSAAIATSDFYHIPTNPSEETKAIEQVYLTGFDTLIRIFNPKYYPNNSMAQVLSPFFARSRLRVTLRTDAEWGDAVAQHAYLTQLRDGRLEEAGGVLEWVYRVEMVEDRKEGEEIVSSTKVREAVRRSDWVALKKLVSEGVAEWIRGEGLYGDGE
ncbi:Nucleotidylyl transferase [Hypoxylon trugodes]|uniref:Nucleotidylyl transferase n=1 Tax=Hypoxylon trugodes TaxID=326681 RepID=UPI00219FF0AD|nr:Nucleotidylyl transferase [Hypoxylon trugodes]KAI1388601.1 Nucleotidylyl transferase [Hypoxylon trugodes]